MQQILGDVNDHYNAVQLYHTLGAKLGVFLSRQGRRYQPLLDRLKAEHETQLQEGCQRFQHWWEGWQKPEIQMAIADVLSSTPATWHLLQETEAAPAASVGGSQLSTALPLMAVRTA
jgi:hypothetical protein